MSRATNLLLLVLVFAFSMGVAEGMPQGATGTPTLVQHVSTGRENTAGTNPSLKVTLPNPTLAGDALILGVEGTSSLTIGTPTDNEGNTWIAGPMINTGGETVASFYVLNAAAGTQVITTPYTGTSSQLNISAVLSEFNNVQTSGAIGPTGTIGSASPVSITLSGSPNLGDLVWMWGADTVTIDPVLKSITAGTNFNLLSANLQAGKMAQYSTSTTSPTASFTTSGTDMFNAVALTLHAASAGTAPGPGIRIVHMQGEWYDTTTHAAQFPCSGNLLVISLASTGVTISAISDSNGNTWSLGASALTSGETAQIMYAANAITSPNMTVNLTYSDPTSYGLNFVHFYDISGALASPHDVDDTRTGDQTTNGNLTSGIITPSQINSLVLNITAIYWHTINGTGTDANGHTPTLNQAVNSIDDDVNPPGTVASQLDDDDGRASIYNSDTKQITFIYTSTAGTLSPNGDGTWSSVTSVFKAAVPTLNPTVTFTGAPSSAPYESSFTVAATTNATTTAVITASGPCSIAGNTVTVTSGTGTCTLTANWAADSNYLAAAATQSTIAAMITPTVAFTGAPSSAPNGSEFTVAATTNASPTAVISASGACSIAGNIVTITSGTGTCSLTANWAADSNYVTAVASQSTVAAGSGVAPTVTFTGAPSSSPFGSSFTVAATTNASTTAVITASGVCSIVGNIVTMTSGTGTCSLTASWAADSNYIATVATQSTTATKMTPTVTFTGAPFSAPYGSGFTVAATTNASTTAAITASGVCSIVGNTVTLTSGTGTCSLTASWATDNNYIAAVATQSTTATAITPTVIFTGAPSNAAYGFSFAVAASTNASTTAVITAGGACSITGNTITMMSGTGACSLTASWAADSNYLAAVATQLTTATMVAPRVAFTGAPSSASYGSGFAVASSTNASTTAVITASGACSIAGNAVTMTSGTGTCSLQASWAGDSNYIAASATQSTVATKITPTVTFNGAPSSAPYESSFTVAATTNASTTAAITASGVCSIAGNAATMTSGTGTCSLKASWATDSNYVAASASESATAAKITPTVTFTGAPSSAPNGSKFTVATTTNASTKAAITASGACSISGSTVTMKSSTGTCSLTASWATDSNYVAASASQSTLASGSGATPTVTFTGAPSSAPYESSFTVKATTNASTTAVITASGPCSIAGNTVTVTSGTGTCSLTASWAADANYVAAVATQSTTATKIAPTVTFTGAPSSAPYKSSFTVAGNTNASTTAAITASGVCSIAGITATMTSGTGTCTLKASWATDSNYVAASASQSTTAAKITPTVTFTGAPSTAAYASKFTVAAATNASTTATLTASGSCTISKTTVTITKSSGTCSLSAAWAADSNYVADSATQSATAIVAIPTVTWATPAAITYGTALSTKQLDATASVAGQFSYTPASGTVLTAGSSPLSVTFTPTDATDYTTATAGVTLQVNPATPTITWGTPASITSGTPLSSTQLDATASVPGTFVYTPAIGTVLAVGSQTLSVAFTPTDTTDYKSATAQVTLVVYVPGTGPVNPPTFFQQNQNETLSGTSSSAAFSAATKAGDTIVAYVIWSNTGTVSLADSLGDTFVKVSSPVTWGSGYSAQIFYATIGAGGTDSVTATYQTALTSFGSIMYINEYAGISAASPVDVSAAATGTSSAMNSGNAATTSTNDLIFGAGVSINTVTAAGSGFTARSSAYGNIVQDKIASTTGSYGATATQNGNQWETQMVAFRAAN